MSCLKARLKVGTDGKAGGFPVWREGSSWRAARGRAGGGRAEPPPAPAGDPWPAGVTPDLRDVTVGIARTEPPFRGRPGMREAERLYLAAIAAARRFLYIENQYLTSNRLGTALAERLAEPAGPEVLIVLPLRKDGWLERTTMDVLRSRLLKGLRAADRYRRLRVCYPHVPGLDGRWVSVHAKVLVADDELVLLGSANMSNRSMGLDTECDLAVEAAGEGGVRAAIAGFRNRLLAEHLGTDPAAVGAAIEGEGSLLRAVDALSREGARSLRPLDGIVPPAVDRLVPDSAVIDPERPVDPETFIEDYVPPAERVSGQRRALAFAGLLLVLVGLAVAWQWGPLAEWAGAQRLAAWIGALRESPFAFLLVAAVYLVATLLVAPITLLVIATALAFGPWLGFFYAFGASLISLTTTYLAGYVLGRRAVRSLTGTRLNRLSGWLVRRGIMAVAVLRLVPVAPFTVINLVAGAIRIPYRDFMIGSVLGLVPGILAVILFADSLVRMVAEPGWRSLAVLAGVTGVIIAAALVVRRWLRGRRPYRKGKA